MRMPSTSTPGLQHNLQNKGNVKMPSLSIVSKKMLRNEYGAGWYQGVVAVGTQVTSTCIRNGP